MRKLYLNLWRKVRIELILKPSVSISSKSKKTKSFSFLGIGYLRKAFNESFYFYPKIRYEISQYIDCMDTKEFERPIQRGKIRYKTEIEWTIKIYSQQKRMLNARIRRRKLHINNIILSKLRDFWLWIRYPFENLFTFIISINI